MRLFCVLAMCGLAPAVAAQEQRGWTCTNTDMQVSCDGGKCEAVVGEGFTPMSVSVEPARLNVCAYSGCWEGAATLVEDYRLIYAHSLSMTWTQSGDRQDTVFQVAIDKVTGIGILNGEGFAHPMHCVPRH